jgi:hypothetical protein
MPSLIFSDFSYEITIFPVSSSVFVVITSLSKKMPVLLLILRNTSFE